jgi:hypothetical protein
MAGPQCDRTAAQNAVDDGRERVAVVLVDVRPGEIEDSRHGEPQSLGSRERRVVPLVGDLEGTVRVANWVLAQRPVGARRQPVDGAGRRNEQVPRADAIKHLADRMPDGDIATRVFIRRHFYGPVLGQEGEMEQQRRYRRQLRHAVECRELH